MKPLHRIQTILGMTGFNQKYWVCGLDKGLAQKVREALTMICCKMNQSFPKCCPCTELHVTVRGTVSWGFTQPRSAPCTRVKLLCVNKPPPPPAFHTSFRCILSDILNAERLRDADHLHLAPCPQDTRLQEKRPLSGGLR